MTDPSKLDPGAILFLERQIPALPYPTGYWVLCKLTEATATLGLLEHNDLLELVPGVDKYEISVEDLSSFTLTKETAKVEPT